MYRSSLDNLAKIDNGDVCGYSCDNWRWKSDGVRVEENVQGCSRTGYHLNLAPLNVKKDSLQA